MRAVSTESVKGGDDSIGRDAQLLSKGEVLRSEEEGAHPSVFSDGSARRALLGSCIASESRQRLVIRR